MGHNSMIPLFVSGCYAITGLGFGIDEIVKNIELGKTAIEKITDLSLFPEPLAIARIERPKIKENFSKIGNPSDYTTLEMLMILSAYNAIRESGINAESKTGFVIATTKGNIDLISTNPLDERIYLPVLARRVARFFKNNEMPQTVCHACISGVSAIIAAANLIETGFYDTIVIVAGDIQTKFTVSGFSSFKSLSQEPCKPFDAARAGLSLGEGAGAIVLNRNQTKWHGKEIRFLGGATSNDANHISGPSRTGDGLDYAIKGAIKGVCTPKEIDFISAHGTATLFNDEMESKAFNLAGMSKTPLNSLKGYFGHTLGAAGVVETALGFVSLRDDKLFKSLGYSVHGVPENLNIITETRIQSISTMLKTASGFGGCNATALFGRF